MRLTASNIRALELPAGKTERIFFDSELPGFGLRIRSGGSKTWCVQYKFGTKHRRIVLGSLSTLDPGKARETAKDLLAAVRLGRDPAGDRTEAQAKTAETFGALLPRFLARQRARLKPRSYEEVERHLLVHSKWLHSRPIAELDRRAIALRLSEIADNSGPTAANSVRASLSACFSWMLREGLLEANPAAYTNKAVEGGARDRVLGDAELADIWKALPENHYGAIIKLLTLTGSRRDEIGSLRWSEIDLEHRLITLPGERTKNRLPQEIPLGPAAMEIVNAQAQRAMHDGSQRDLVFGFGETRGFQAWSTSKLDLDARILSARKAAGVDKPIPGWRLHDLRRTCSTRMHGELRVQPHIVEAVLGHIKGHRSGVAGVYNRATYREEKARALALWGDYVTAAVGAG
jgi:integrase